MHYGSLSLEARSGISRFTVSKYVPETAIDYDAVFSRGAKSYDDEDFALCKCPRCGHVYLMDYEVDNLYLDGNDPSKIINVASDDPVICVTCRTPIPSGRWVGPLAEDRFMVTWEELAASAWSWIAIKPIDP